MTKVVLLHEGELPTLVELYNSLQNLSKRYGNKIKKIKVDRLNVSDFQDMDVLISVRCHSPLSYGILKLAARLEKKFSIF